MKVFKITIIQAGTKNNQPSMTKDNNHGNGFTHEETIQKIKEILPREYEYFNWDIYSKKRKELPKQYPREQYTAEGIYYIAQNPIKRIWHKGNQNVKIGEFKILIEKIPTNPTTKKGDKS